MACTSSANANVPCRGNMAIISGGSSGIGRECVKKFLAEGINVVFCSNDRSSGEATEGELNNNAHLNDNASARCYFVEADVTKPNEVANVVNFAVQQAGRIDYLVNNVGHHPPHRFIDQVPLEEFHHLFQVNVTSAFLFSQLCLPHLRKVKGSIVNISSMVAITGQRAAISYVTSKGALNSFTLGLAIDEGQHGVRVNIVSPGPTDTPLLRLNFSQMAKVTSQAEEELAAYAKTCNAMKKFATPQEVSAAVLFLARDATHCTGVNLPVSGGEGLSPMIWPICSAK